MDKRNELLMKVKALAALEAGVVPWPNSAEPDKWHRWKTTATGLDGETHATPMEALTAAADVLGIAPDLTVMALTEDEEAILNDALCNYRDWAEKESESPYKTEEGCKYWRDTAESAESLRLRLCGGA